MRKDGSMKTYICRYWHESEVDEWTGKIIKAGFRESTIIVANTRGQAKSKYVQFLNRDGYDPHWTDKFSIKLEKEY